MMRHKQSDMLLVVATFVVWFAMMYLLYVFREPQAVWLVNLILGRS